MSNSPWAWARTTTNVINMASDGAPRSQSHLTQIHRQNGQQQRGAVLLNFRWTTVRGEEAPLRSELPSDNASA